jgi:hypothetical protein
MGKRVLAACLPVLVLVVTAGCSTSNDGKGVASVSGTAAPSTTPSLSVLEQGRRHAQCMRDHDVPVADPQVQPDGHVRLGGGYDKHAVDDDVLAKAIEACKQYRPVLSGPDQEKKLEGARGFARCMRAHGVESFPDPDPNDLGTAPPDTVRDDPQYQQARETCWTQGASQSPGATRS